MIDVLIVGAGPTGLSLACDLARSGTSFRIVDAGPGTSPIMKATVLMPLSLEYFADLGLVDRCLERGVEAREMAIYAEGEPLVRKSFAGVETPYPFFLLLGQHNTERFLAERLAEVGGAVAWNTRLSALDPASGERPITAVLERDGKAPETVEARFVVGCDGARSSVGEFCGAEYKDLDFPTDYVVAELEIDCAVRRDSFNVFFAEAGPLAVAAMPDGKWGMMAALPPQAEGQSRTRTEPSLGELQAIWNERCPYPGTLSNPTWMSHYRDHVKVTKTPLPPGVFLAGDAVHQVSPLSSLGMNSGILDARNLGWKLALASRGLARPSVLASYDVEHLKQLAPAVVLSVMNEIAYPFRASLLRKYRDAMLGFLFNIGPVWRFFTRYQTQKERSLRSSPIVAQHVAFPVRGDDTGGVGDAIGTWLAFGEGPHAGDLAPDVTGLLTAVGEDTRLFEHLFCGCHTLVFFDGAAMQPGAGDAAFEALARVVAALPDGVARAARIVRELPAAGTVGAEIIVDPEGAAHARYGAEGPCLYLVRPDGYVGFRAAPPDAIALEDYLSTILILPDAADDTADAPAS